MMKPATMIFMTGTILGMALQATALQAAEDNDGELGNASVGSIGLVLDITDGAGEGYLRLCYATSIEVIDRALESMAEFFNKIHP